MIKEENKTSFDWVYYVLGLFFGILTGAIVLVVLVIPYWVVS